MNKLPIKSFFLFLISVLLISCGKDTRQSQSNLTSPLDDETKFARSVYGEKTDVLLKGDFTAAGKSDVLAGVVKIKVNDKQYWIEKGGVIEKDKDGWKTLLNLDSKLSSSKGELISQVNAKNGYILRINDKTKPITFTVTMADENGKGASDEATIKWNSKNDAYELASDNETSIQ